MSKGQLQANVTKPKFFIWVFTTPKTITLTLMKKSIFLIRKRKERSMKIQLYKNNSKKNILDKTSFLEEITTLEGMFKNTQSIISPTILIDLKSNYLLMDDDSILVMDSDNNLVTGNFVSDTLLLCNYSYIDELHRYYYIDDIQVVNSNLVQLSLRVDSLMSHRDDLLKNILLISRNQTYKNVFLEDTQTQFVYDKKIEYITPENLSDVKKLDPTLPSMIFSYLTTDDLSNPVYVQDIPGLPNIYTFDTGTGINTQYYRILVTDIFELSKVIYKKDTLLSYIKGIYLYPFDVDLQDSGDYVEDKIHLGLDTENPITIHHASIMYQPSRIVIADFKMREATSYLDYSPYSTYKIFVPYCDFVELSGESILGKEIKVFYSVNFDDGSTVAYIYNQTDEKILFSQRCYMSTQISLSTTNLTEINNQKTALALNTAISGLSSSVSLALGVATMNPVAIMGGTMGLAKTVTNNIAKSNQMYDKGNTAMTSLVDGSNNLQHVFIKKITQVPLTDSYYREWVGYPLNQYKKLSTLVGSGFTLIDSDSHIHLKSATKTEIDDIENILHSGIIM